MQQRGLRVAVGGAGTTFFQRQVRRFGSFVPGLVSPDKTLGDLARLNYSAYLAFASILAQTVVRLVVRGFEPTLVADLVSSLLMLTVWLAGRASLQQQVCLAKNAKMVLRIMAAASSRRGGLEAIAPGPLVPSTPRPASTRKSRASRYLAGANSRPAVLTADSHAILLTQLPWLPAFDRRDVLAVQELLVRSRPDLRPSSETVVALSFSAHTAARLCHSPGDASAETLPLSAWLRERNIDLHGENSVCLEELRPFAWTIAAGSHCALLTPLGAYKLASPSGGQWTMADSVPLSRASIGRLVALLLWVYFFQYITSMILSQGKTHLEVSNAANGVTMLSNLLIAPLLLVIQLGICRADWGSLRTGRTPLPFAVFNDIGKNCLLGLVLLLGCGALSFAAFGSYLHVIWTFATVSHLSAATRSWGEAYAVSGVVSNTIASLCVLYQLVLALALIASTCRKRGWAWARRKNVLCFEAPHPQSQDVAPDHH